jgi:hypothetical protein
MKHKAIILSLYVILISFFWLVGFIFGLAVRERDVSLILVAISPLLIVGAVWWIVKGFKANKADKRGAKAGVKSIAVQLNNLEKKVHKFKSVG